MDILQVSQDAVGLIMGAFIVVLILIAIVRGLSVTGSAARVGGAMIGAATKSNKPAGESNPDTDTSPGYNYSPHAGGVTPSGKALERLQKNAPAGVDPFEYLPKVLAWAEYRGFVNSKELKPADLNPGEVQSLLQEYDRTHPPKKYDRLGHRTAEQVVFDIEDEFHTMEDFKKAAGGDSIPVSNWPTGGGWEQTKGYTPKRKRH